jgi:formylglycine-generating enzyme
MLKNLAIIMSLLPLISGCPASEVQVERRAPAVSGDTVDAPTFSLAAGSYGPAQSVELSTSTPDAVIYYTTDGSQPTMESVVYSAPINVATSMTLKAFAVKSGFSSSEVVEASYAINGQLPSPAILIGDGAFGPAMVLSISSSVEDVVIYYTVDGTNPNFQSAKYEGPIPVLSSMTIRAIATKSGFIDSAESKFMSILTPPLTFELASGSSTNIDYSNYLNQNYYGLCYGGANVRLEAEGQLMAMVPCLDSKWAVNLSFSSLKKNGNIRLTASLTSQDQITVSRGIDLTKMTPVYPLSVWVGGGGFSFTNGFGGVPPTYARGISWAKVNANLARYEQKLATLDFPETNYTFDISEVTDLVASEDPLAELSYASVELVIVDSENRVFAYTTANTSGAADPIKLIEDNRVSISVGDLPSLNNQSISGSWVFGENAWNANFIFKALTSYDQPALPTDDDRFARIGDIGNDADTGGSLEPLAAGSVPVSGWGKVDYEYQISKYLVTMEEYAEFLNAVAQTDTYQLYTEALSTDTAAGGIKRSGVDGKFRYQVVSGTSKRPVTYVSWLDAARYVNWLHNGKPIGAQDASTTEAGAYALNGATAYGEYPRSSSARYFLPTEHEWYKAAFYKGNGTNAGYWSFATQSDDAPTASAIDGVNVANCSSVASGTTDVDLFASSVSYYGTYDQSGNAWQWLEGEGPSSGQKARRGGSWANDCTGSPSRLSSSVRSSSPIDSKTQHLGFRVGKKP